MVGVGDGVGIGEGVGMGEGVGVGGMVGGLPPLLIALVYRGGQNRRGEDLRRASVLKLSHKRACMRAHQSWRGP